MTGKDAIRNALNMNHHVTTMYLGDLSDADLLVRPAPSANHIAWQLGHLIAAEATFFLPLVPGATPPELPKGFAEQHSKETAGSDKGFRTKEEYLSLFNKVRQST